MFINHLFKIFCKCHFYAKLIFYFNIFKIHTFAEVLLKKHIYEFSTNTI